MNLTDKINKDNLPKHLAIIMDGNGRWAKQKGLMRAFGHENGTKSVRITVETCAKLGIENLTLYAFSTENWRRSPEEVRFLMNFNRDVIRRRRDEMNDMGVRIRWAGRRPKLWRSVIEELEACEKLTAKNSKLTVTMCVNYGGRAEIVDAATELARDVKRGKVKADSINEKTLEKYLYSPKMRDVDMFLRSSGEQRTSNFLPWQSSYAEFVFMDVLWPDMTPKMLWKAIEIYSARERRFGSA